MPGGLPLIKSETYMETVLGHADYCDIHKHYYFSPEADTSLPIVSAAK